jgi:hypothetical protein
LFPQISLITAALSTAILVMALAWQPKVALAQHGMPPIVKIAAHFIGWALLLLILYPLLFNFTTLDAPSGKRLQIGFGMETWTLTDAGKDWVRAQPTITKGQMAASEAAFEQDRLAILWRTWSIYFAGSLLIVLYFLCFTLWTTGFALLAKHRHLTRAA